MFGFLRVKYLGYSLTPTKCIYTKVSKQLENQVPT